VGFVLRIFSAHAVHTFSAFCTADFAKPAGITKISAAVTVFAAFLADHRTFLAGTTSKAEFIAGAAVVAVVAPEAGGTVHTDAAILAEAIAVTVVTLFPTLGTQRYAIFTALSAALTDDGAKTTQSTVHTETSCIFRAFHTGSTVSTVRITVAGSTVAAAFGTDTTAT